MTRAGDTRTPSAATKGEGMDGWLDWIREGAGEARSRRVRAAVPGAIA